MKESLRVLLDRLIDYAGLYPPASLPLDEAVANYERYRAGSNAWMLGRFVVPAAQAALVPRDYPLAVVGIGDGETIELKAANAEEVEAIAKSRGEASVYVEVGDIGLIEQLGRRGLRAKVRTGGVTPEAIPSHAHVAAFIRLCAANGTPFKATAGLHHPIRCVRPLTYESDSAQAMMHGFINVFMAAAFVHEAERVLVEEDPSAFRFEDDVASWRDHSVATEHLRDVRQQFAISFGSCSFEEPVEALGALGWL